ncbi:hypothetical protein [Alienimonas sp. DA493]|uniref:hypothetical protein n=1 Tax=Alienimonas sp. DA493 TaxID=3373605 RepID=UPI003754D933
MSSRPHGARLARRDDADSYGASAGSLMELSGFDLQTFDSETAAEGYERSRSDGSRGADRPTIPLSSRRVAATRAAAPASLDDDDDDDLPEALVGSDDEFLDALQLPEVKQAPARKKRPRPAPAPAVRKPAAAASAGAAADLLKAHGVGDAEDCDDDFDDEPLAAGPIPPRRGRKRRPAAPEAAPAKGVNPNVLVLATVLTIPALALGLHHAFGERQTTRAEWREAFDQLDDLMNEFTDVAHAPEEEWTAWKIKFEIARPALRAKTEAAPDASAGGEIDRAINTLEQAVELRADGASREVLDKTVRRAVGHAQNAAGRLGLTKFEWAK